MAYGNRAGRARTNKRAPRAQAVCDRCGFWYQLDALSRQYQWAGPALQDTGLLVCRRCLDTPQPQFRTFIFPPDPVPRVNPRPDIYTTLPATAGGTTPPAAFNLGFQVYILGSPSVGRIPFTKAEALAALAEVSGIPTPVGPIDRSITITGVAVSQEIMAENLMRSWVAIYNPHAAPVAINTATVVWGADGNVMLGPGQAMYWAEDQGNGAVWPGVIDAAALQVGTPVWAWEA